MIGYAWRCELADIEPADRQTFRDPRELPERCAQANAAVERLDEVYGEWVGPWELWGALADEYGRDVVRAYCTHPEIVTYWCGAQSAPLTRAA